ncbi:hypothetical protein JCM10207_009016 [Rhodosporidiobolus poonsookiae]
MPPAPSRRTTVGAQPSTLAVPQTTARKPRASLAASLGAATAPPARLSTHTLATPALTSRARGLQGPRTPATESAAIRHNQLIATPATIRARRTAAAAASTSLASSAATTAGRRAGGGWRASLMGGDRAAREKLQQRRELVRGPAEVALEGLLGVGYDEATGEETGAWSVGEEVAREVEAFQTVKAAYLSSTEFLDARTLAPVYPDELLSPQSPLNTLIRLANTVTFLSLLFSAAPNSETGVFDRAKLPTLRTATEALLKAVKGDNEPIDEELMRVVVSLKCQVYLAAASISRGHVDPTPYFASQLQSLLNPSDSARKDRPAALRFQTLQAAALADAQATGGDWAALRTKWSWAAAVREARGWVERRVLRDGGAAEEGEGSEVGGEEGEVEVERLDFAASAAAASGGGKVKGRAIPDAGEEEGEEQDELLDDDNGEIGQASGSASGDDGADEDESVDQEEEGATGDGEGDGSGSGSGSGSENEDEQPASAEEVAGDAEGDEEASDSSGSEVEDEVARQLGANSSPLRASAAAAQAGQGAEEEGDVEMGAGEGEALDSQAYFDELEDLINDPALEAAAAEEEQEQEQPVASTSRSRSRSGAALGAPQPPAAAAGQASRLKFDGQNRLQRVPAGQAKPRSLLDRQPDAEKIAFDSQSQLQSQRSPSPPPAEQARSRPRPGARGARAPQASTRADSPLPQGQEEEEEDEVLGAVEQDEYAADEGEGDMNHDFGGGFDEEDGDVEFEGGADVRPDAPKFLQADSDDEALVVPRKKSAVAKGKQRARSEDFSEEEEAPARTGKKDKGKGKAPAPSGGGGSIAALAKLFTASQASASQPQPRREPEEDGFDDEGSTASDAAAERRHARFQAQKAKRPLEVELDDEDDEILPRQGSRALSAGPSQKKRRGGKEWESDFAEKHRRRARDEDDDDREARRRRTQRQPSAGPSQPQERERAQKRASPVLSIVDSDVDELEEEDDDSDLEILRALPARSQPRAEDDRRKNGQKRPWTASEERFFIDKLKAYGCYWADLAERYGGRGKPLDGRSNVDLKDKARNMKMKFIRAGQPVPGYLTGATEYPQRVAPEPPRPNVTDDEDSES